MQDAVLRKINVRVWLGLAFGVLIGILSSILGIKFGLIAAVPLCILLVYKFFANHKSKATVLLFLFIFEFLMEPVPSKLTISNIGFSIFTFLLFMAVFSKANVIMRNAWKIFFMIFITFIGISFYSIVIKQVPVLDVIRGIVPFCFFFLFLPILKLELKGKLNGEKLLFGFVIWGLLYCFNNIYLFIVNAIEGMALYRRITLLDPNTNSQLPLFIASISFYMIFINERILFSKKKWYFILFVSFLGIAVTQTRSMLICLLFVMFLIMVYFFVNKYFKSLVQMTFSIMFIVFTMIILIFLFEPIRNLFASIVNRFTRFGQGDANVTDRVHEYQAAFEVFANNPLFGGGIGLKFSEHDGVIVNYIHNSPLYFLANIGLFGYLIILLILFLIIFWSFKSKNNVVIALNFGFIAILCYSLFFAIFKWFSQNIIISIMFATSYYFYNFKINSGAKDYVKK